MIKRDIISPSLYTFCFELQEAIQQGFVIDPDNTPTTWGIAYECSVIKESDDLPALLKPPTEVPPSVPATKKAGRPFNKGS